MTAVWVGLAGAVGALCRYGIALLGAALTSASYPWGTLVANVVGSLLLGLVAGLAQERKRIPPQVYIPVATGFLGAYTTFSTWSIDTLLLWQDGRYGAAVTNVVTSIALGLAALWLGLRLSRRSA